MLNAELKTLPKFKFIQKMKTLIDETSVSINKAKE